MSSQKVVKILVMGSNDDKTAIIQRYAYKQFNKYSEEQHSSSCGFVCKRVRVDSDILKIQLWDIANQNRFAQLASNYYKYACAAVIVFDITNKKSLEKAKKWKQDLDENVLLQNGHKLPVVLVANKWDKVEENENVKQISDTELDEFCEKNKFIAWFSCSAKTGMNVKKMFNFLIWKIIQNKKKLDRKSSPKYSKQRNNSTSIEQNVSNQHKARSKTLDGLLSYFNNNNNNNNTIKTADHYEDNEHVA